MNELEKCLKDVDFTLQNVGYREFTIEAFQKFKESIGVYISSLFIESHKLSKRDKADNISSSHVESASRYLVKYNKSKFSKLLGILGGSFFGATVSSMLAMSVQSQQSNIFGINLIIVMGIIGSFLIGINIMKD
jgi:hypothetical protein